MADEEVIEIPEEGVIEVPLEGVAAEPKAKVAEPEPEPKPEPKQAAVRDPKPEADAALKAAQSALDNEKRLREAAEQNVQTAVHRATQAEQRSQTHQQELQTERERAEASEAQRIDREIDNATKLIASSQKEYVAAMAAGNFEQAAEAQTKLSKATATLDRWEGRKEDFATAKVNRGTEGRVVEEPPPTQPASHFERYISGLAPKAQTWLRAHPECVPAEIGGDATMNAKMMRGHYEALSKGYTTNSDDYFKTIDLATGFRKPDPPPEPEVKDEEVVEVKPTPKPKERTKVPAAPPSREPPGTPPGGSTMSVRLTLDEQATARFSFPNLTPAQAYAEYAKNKVALQAEGKLGRTSH